MKKFSIIFACDSKNWIWKNGDLPWSIKEDLKYFKSITSNSIEGKKNALIMWIKTWESIPEIYKPLSERINCILSRSHSFEDKNWEVRRFSSFESAMQNLSLDDDINKIFVVGWAYLYNKVFLDKNLEYIYKTNVAGDFGCDVFVNNIPKEFILEKKSEIKNENELEFNFEIYKKTLS